jgi:hypothetical protein
MSRRRRGGAPYAQTQQPTRREAEQALSGQIMPLVRGRQLDIGDLSGDTVEPVLATFSYFGKQFRVNPNLTETMLVDLLEDAEEIGSEGPMQLVAAKDYVRNHLHAEDFDEFWDTVVDNRQGINQVIKLCWKLLELVTDRPTSPPSDSSDGRPATVTSLPAGASEPATGNVRDVAEKFIKQFEAEGRPDKANFVALAVESREARGLVTV